MGEWYLSDDEQATLLVVARQAIRSQLAGETYTLPEAGTRLYERGAAFVTLHLDGQLRGCIGELEARQALIESVRRNALNAAFKDPRFPPLTAEEYPGIDIEISCLTPAVPIADLDQFEIGRHGIIMERGPTRAVFLPQVPVEYNWTRETTVQHLCAKAGLPRDAWRDASFRVFEAIVFGETPHPA